MSTTALIIQLLLVVAVFAGVFSLVIVITRRRARATRSPESEREYVRAGFGLTTSWKHGGRVARGASNGVGFVLTIVPQSKCAPPHAVLAVPSALRGDFEVVREESVDRFFKRVGLTSEVQTGDSQFDREAYLGGGTREYLESLFGDAHNREAVRALFRLGFDRLSLRGGRLTAVNPHWARLPELDALRSALGRIAGLRATPGVLAAAQKTTCAPSTGQILYGSLILVIAGFALLIVAAFNTRALTDGLEAMIESAWPAAVAACLAIAALAAVLLRGRPLGHQELAGVLFMGLPGLCTGGLGGAMLANQYLDESAAHEHVTRVERSYRASPRSKWGFIIVLAPWGAVGRSSASMGASHDARPGERWIVRTRSGRLGYEWIESARPAPDA